MKTMTFMLAMRDFFGSREGQSPTAFLKECREACGAANDDNRAFWTEGLKANGYEIVGTGSAA